MRVLVTGSSGFVGRWLQRELLAAGHDVVETPDPPALEIADLDAVRRLVADAHPDAVAHLAGVAYAPDATGDAANALRVNVGGTHAVLEACRTTAPDSAVLVVGSSEVYVPPMEEATLTEGSPVGPRGVYGLTKLAAEALALAAAGRGLRVAVARSFNHTGPGQRPVFAVPAFAGRILEAKRTRVHTIRAGNVDVARDIGDVRDVVRAYRMLLEALAEDRVPADRRVLNVASGRAVTMRWIIDELARQAGWRVEIERDPALIRADDPPVIRGDASALRELTGWTPRHSIEETLAALWVSLDRGAPA